MNEREDEALTRRLADAARSMQAETGSQDTLDNAVTAAVQVIKGCDLAGASVAHQGGIDTSAGSGPDIKQLDSLQYEMGEGPCLDALKEHETVTSRDLAQDSRWPRWGPHVAAEIGLRSILSYRLFTTSSTLGALNLYSYAPEAFDFDDTHDGMALAAHVAVALAGAQNIENLERAITSRTVIGQAEGILMERFDLSAARAFDVLRRVSQDSNTKLHAVADRLVRTRRTPGTEEHP